ncbi:MAG TPA: hypothetical protein VGJ90_07335 [Methylophilaceae bacterium]|jgi:hypothetical protein
MTQRITIGLLEDAELALVKQRLIALGLEILSMPSTYLPNVIVATIPATWKMEDYLEKIKQISGISYAEADAWRASL